MGSVRKNSILAVVLIVIIGTIFLLEKQGADPSDSVVEDAEITVEDTMVASDAEGRIAQKAQMYERAKEISTPNAFINTASTSIAELIGEKVILVDFWTYSCINCQRTLPYLNSWHEKYADDGLVILGIHTPEFEFEKELANVKRAVEKWDVQYPVVLDNDYSTWRSYKNRYWPRKYLIDIDGFIVYDHIGEGAYEETERVIVDLLNERSRVLGAEAVALEDEGPRNVDSVDFSQVGSPETYLGSDRQMYLANLPGQSCLEGACLYAKNQPYVLNRYQLNGQWLTADEYASPQSAGASITYRFKASKVNLVVSEGQRSQAEIYLDGVLVSDQYAGDAVVDGNVTFDEADLYNLIDLSGSYEEHVIEIRFLDGGVHAFAFTFG